MYMTLVWFSSLRLKVREVPRFRIYENDSSSQLKKKKSVAPFLSYQVFTMFLFSFLSSFPFFLGVWGEGERGGNWMD